MSSCTLFPTIKVGKEERESKLFRDLLSYTGNRESAQTIWALSQIPEVRNNLKGIELDDNGEPTLESLNKELDIKALLDGKVSLLGEKISLGATDSKGNSIIYKDPTVAINKVIEFNAKNPRLIADVSKGESGYTITVEERTTSNSETPKRLKFNSVLNNKLLGIVRSLGFDVKINDSLTYGGIFNPLNAETTADGLKVVIQVAKGQLGEDSFPEEFSHLIIEGLTQSPLVGRLLGSVKDIEVVKAVLGDSYETYKDLYKNNLYMLQKEAAAKLLQKHIISRDASIIKPLLSRIWDFVKKLFSSISEKDINKAIDEANQEASELARVIDDGSILPLIDKDAILAGETLYNVAKETNKLEDLANKALETSSKRLRILMLKSKRGRYNINDMEEIKKLQDLIEKKKYAKSCLRFLTDSLSQIERLDSQLDRIREDAEGETSDIRKIKRVSSLLRNIKDFSEGYTPVIQDMMNVVDMWKSGEIEITEEDAELISQKAKDIFAIINNINRNYKSFRYNTVYNFLKLYWGKDKTIKVGKDKGKQLTLSMIMDMADKDINGVDAWVSSLSDSSDAMLSLIDKAVKVSHYRRDEILLGIREDLRAAHKKLQDAGYTSDFMYERDSEGNLTGRIISDIDFIRFNKERKAYIEKLEKQGLEPFQIKQKLEKWEILRTEEVLINKETGRTERLPAKAIYGTSTLSTLSKEQREYYDTMLEAKTFLDDLLPTRFVNTYRAVQIRNDLTEALVNNITDPKEATRLFIGNLKDRFLRRSDDTEFGGDEASSLFTTFSGKPVDSLPVYYTTELEDMSRLSTDFTSSILAYAGMAVDYNEMNKIIDALELTKDLVMDREVQQFSGDKKLEEAFTVLHKKFNRYHTVSGSKSNIGKKLENYYQSVIYGRKKQDQGTIVGDLDTAKTLDALKDYTGVVGLGLNLFSAVSNVVAGKMQMFIDAIGGEFFGYKDMAKGKKQYYSLLPQYMAEINAVQKTNKLALLIDKFDALEEFYGSLKSTGYYKGPLSRIIGSSNLFFLNSIGEHYLHTRTMLSILNSVKVKLGDSEVSLYDALEEDIKKDSDGNIISATIKVKDGVTNLDGSDFTDKDLMDIKLKISKVNQSLNGAFNEDDKGAIHRGALGRLMMQFRQWMPAHYSRRFSKTRYDARLDQYREGFYYTAYKFSLELIRDLRRAKFEVGTQWNNLSEHEKANMRRTFAEIGLFIALSVLLNCFGDTDDHEGVWHDRMILYTLKRAKLETGASMPLNFEFPKNIWTTIQSPAAALKQIDNMTALLRFDNINKEVQSGRFKGWSKYEADIARNLPIYSNIKKVFDITNEEYMFTIFNR